MQFSQDPLMRTVENRDHGVDSSMLQDIKRSEQSSLSTVRKSHNAMFYSNVKLMFGSEVHSELSPNSASLQSSSRDYNANQESMRKIGSRLEPMGFNLEQLERSHEGLYTGLGLCDGVSEGAPVMLRSSRAANELENSEKVEEEP